MIGSLYNKKGVVVGQAAGFYAAEDTPLPLDTGVVFDEVAWGRTTIAIANATGGTFSLTFARGPLLSPITVTNLAYNITPTALAAAITAALPTGYTAVVTGTAGNYVLALVGPASLRILITGNGTGLTGTTPTFLLTASPWSTFGGTEQGWSTNYNVQSQSIRIEEQVTQVGEQISEAGMEFTANLSEDNLSLLKMAMASTLTVTAAATGVFGKEKLTLANDLPVVAVALETKNRAGYPRRFYIPGATCAVNVGQTFRRAAAQRMIPVTFKSVCETERIVIDEIVSPAL